MVETMSEGAVTIAPDGVILYCNRRFADMLKAEPQTVIGSNLLEHFAGDNIAKVTAAIHESQAATTRVQVNLLASDATPVPVTIAMHRQRFGETQSIALVVTDVTEIVVAQDALRDSEARFRQAEESIRRSEAELKEVQHLARLGTWNLDPASGAVTWSEELYNIMGLDPRLPAPNVQQQAALFKPHSYAALTAALQTALKDGTPYALELEFIRPDATEGWMLARGEAERGSDGGVRRVHGMALDITEQRQATLKLEEEEVKFRSLVEQNVAGIVIIREDGTLAYCNAYFANLIGYTPAEIIGRPLLDFLPEAERSIVRESLRSDMFERGEFVQLASILQARDGRILDVLVNASRSTFEGRPAAIAVVLDITERKQAEVRLNEARAQLTEAQAVAHVGSWQLDLRTNSAELSDECYRIFHVDPATFVPSREAFLALVHPDDREAVVSAHERSLEDSTSWALDHRIVLDDGTVRFAHQRWKNDYDADGRPLRTIGTIQDITEWKTAENALRQERDFSTALINSLPGLFVVIDETGHLVRWNKNLVTLTGLSDEQLQGLDALMIAIPSDRDAVKVKTEDAFLHGQSEVEFRIRTKAGDVRMMHWSGQTIRSDGHLSLVTVGIDITEMREAAEHLQASEAKYRELFESTRDALMVMDPSTGTVISGNPAAVKMFGAKDEADFISHPPWTLSPERQPDGRRSAEKMREITETTMREGTNFFEWTHQRANGEEFSAEVLLTRIIQGQKTLIFGTVRDITERVRAAESLAYRDHVLHAVTLSAAKLVTGSSLATAMPPALRTMAEALRIDRMFILKWFSTAAEPSRVEMLYAWQAADVVQINSAMFAKFPAEPELAAWQAPLLDGKPVMTYADTATGIVAHIMQEMKNLSTLFVPIFVSGKYWGQIAIDDCKTVRQWTSVEIDTLGTLSELIGSMILREQAQASLQQSEERFRAVSETAQDAIIMIDSAAQSYLLEPAAETILGYTKDEAMGKCIHEWITPPRFRDRAIEGMKEFARTGRGRIFGKTLELAATRKDGREIPVEISVANMFLNKEWHAVAILRDITERKRSEESSRAWRARIS